MKRPAQKTLDRYGLTLDEWEEILARQGGVCAICMGVPGSGRLCIDHEHVAGWKKMSPNERKRYVRGLVCTLDNHFILTRYGSPEKFRAAARFLEEYEGRRDG